MLHILARQATQLQGTGDPPPAPLIDLETALAHMPEATAQDIDDNLTGWYTSLQAPNGPTTTAAAYATLGSELRSKGNPNETGPQFLVCNPGQGQLHLPSGLIERPANVPDKLLLLILIINVDTD